MIKFIFSYYTTPRWLLILLVKWVRNCMVLGPTNDSILIMELYRWLELEEKNTLNRKGQ
jgi:hypothetical protein